jgi:hypothetical protein
VKHEASEAQYRRQDRAGAEGTTMQELRFVAVSEDGRYAVLAVPGRSARFTLPIDERLRAVALGQTSRLAQYEIEVESPLRPKEIQARIRAGETVEEIADAAGIAVERVRWFEGPVLAERAYMADQAQLASVRRPGDAIPSSPGPRLGEIVTERLKALGSDPEEAQWDARKLGDGSWQVQLTFISGGRLHTAEWTFDPRRRHVVPADDNASRMSLPGGGEPPQPAASTPGEATVTHLGPRLSAAGFGSGAVAGGAVGNGLGSPLGNGVRARLDRPAPVRPPAPEPRAAEPRVAEQQISEPQFAEPQVVEPEIIGAREDEGREDEHGAAEHGAAEPQAPERREAEAPAAPPAAPEAEAQNGAESAARQGRKTARGRRSSVPSWDEIMFGNSRQRD